MHGDRRLRVAITIGPSGPGGIGLYARELATALARRDDVETLVIGTEAARRELGTTPAAFIRMRGGRLGEQTGVAALGPILRRRRVDLVHGTRHVVPMAASPPRVLTFHDDFVFARASEYDPVKRTLLPAVYRRSLAVADAVVTLSSEVAAVAREHVGDHVPVTDAGAAIATDLAAASTSSVPDGTPARYALVVGDAGPRKRIDRLLDAWTDVESATGLSLVVAGGRAASPDLVTRLERSAATFVRLPSTADLAALYHHATLVVDAAAAEGFGFPRVEAAHFGVPYLVLGDGDDPASLLGAALDDAATAPEVAATTWDQVAERTMAVYRRVLRA